METRQLGKDGPQVSVICFGAWPIGGGMGPVAEDQAIAAVHAALDAGVTFIDTAENYLGSEAILGQALRGRRHEAFLATKLSGDHSPRHIAQAVDNSLKLLDAGHIDLYQLHNPDPGRPIDETMGDLVRLRDAGKIKYVGLSNFSADQTAEAVEHCSVHSAQPLFNMLYRDLGDTVLPVCLANGVSVIPHSVLAQGLLTGGYRPGKSFPADDERSRFRGFKGEMFERTYRVTERLDQWARDNGRDLVRLAIAWTLAQPRVTSAIVGAKSPSQVRHNASAADWKLSEDELKEVAEIQGDLRLHGSPYR